MQPALRTKQGLLAIAQATVLDIPTIIELANRIWPVAYDGILTPEQISNILGRIYTPPNLEKEMDAGHRFWLAGVRGNNVAYASAYKDSGSIWIKKIYVDPAYKKQGIGSRMLDVAVEALLPATDIRLLANPNNTPAHHFYEQKGFAKIGEVPVQMGDWHFNDFIFSKAL